MNFKTAIWALAISASLSWCYTDKEDCNKVVKAAWEPALPWCLVETTNDTKNKTNDILRKWEFKDNWIKRKK